MCYSRLKNCVNDVFVQYKEVYTQSIRTSEHTQSHFMKKFIDDKMQIDEAVLRFISFYTLFVMTDVKVL